MKLSPVYLALTIVLFCLTAGLMSAAEMKTELTLDSGDHDRSNTPVWVLLGVPKDLAGVEAVKLTDPAGNALTGQLTPPGLSNIAAKTPGDKVLRELHFILPSLGKGKSLKLTATVSAQTARPAEGFSWKDTPGEHAELRYGKRPVLRYMYKELDESSTAAREATFKAFHQVYNPAGTRFVTNPGIGGRFPHHRGLFYGVSRISYGEGKRVNNWGCSGDAYQSHEGFLAEAAGPVLGRHRAAVDWHGQGREVIAKEERELTVYNVPGGLLIEFASRLKSTVGKIKLDGDPQHAGFQFRADKEVAAKTEKQSYYLRPDGKGALGETRNWHRNNPNPHCVNLPWNALSFVLGENRYTAVYLDHPANPKEARYSERTYGRFGSYFEYELDRGKDLAINYRVWLQDGEMTVDEAAALSADFTDPVQVVVK